MHFEITASLRAVRKNLTAAQRNSSLFAEAPRIAGKTLRRGQVLKLTEEQFRQHEVELKRLFAAGAIEIVEVDGKHRRDLRKEQKGTSVKEDSKTVKDLLKVAGPVQVEVPVVPTNPATLRPVEVVKVVDPDVTPVVPAPKPLPEDPPTVEPVLRGHTIDQSIIDEVPMPAHEAPENHSKGGKKGKKA